MQRWLIWLFLSLMVSSSAAAPPASDVAPLPLPSPPQLAWQRDEMTMFVHFGPNTFSDREWGDGTESPRIFNPTDLDTRQWVKSAREAGFKLMILTAKHHDGFCLWPSKYTEHSVKNSPWRGGRGDVVREFVRACRQNKMKVGLYLSPWDRNSALYGTPQYNDYFVHQLTELLTQYGHIDEVWFDGANGEGPNGKTQIYDWPRFYATIRRLQPQALIAIAGPDVRWVGNESGVARIGESSVQPDSQAPGGYKWYPAECDVSIRPGWFYHASEDDKVKPLAQLMEIYFQSVGRNSVLLVNVPPDRRGRFAEPDVRRLREFGAAIRGLHQNEISRGAKVSASSQRGTSFSPSKVLTDDLNSFWSPKENGESWVELNLGAEKKFNVVNVQENIALGERVRRYRIEVERQSQNGAQSTWETIARGTVIGQRNLIPVGEVRARVIRLVIESAVAVPCIARLGVHQAPVVPRRQRLALSQNKPVSVSNVHGQGTTYGGDRAVDGDAQTRWATSDETRACWLVVDLESEQTLTHFELSEFAPRIEKFEIQLEEGNAWRTVFSGQKVGGNFRADFAPVRTRRVRLNILAATAAPTIWEFALYGPEG